MLIASLPLPVSVIWHIRFAFREKGSSCGDFMQTPRLRINLTSPSNGQSKQSHPKAGCYSFRRAAGVVHPMPRCESRMFSVTHIINRLARTHHNRAPSYPHQPSLTEEPKNASAVLWMTTVMMRFIDLLATSR